MAVHIYLPEVKIYNYEKVNLISFWILNVNNGIFAIYPSQNCFDVTSDDPGVHESAMRHISMLGSNENN